MTPEVLTLVAIDPALILLPRRMDSPEARAAMIAIALQESRVRHRRQVGGPARGFWQFELNGVRGVLSHPQSRPNVLSVVDTLEFPAEAERLSSAIAYNDVLAAAFARLLLWTLPVPLPGRDDPASGWRQYLEAWRPGKPHESTWREFWDEAWEFVEGKRP